MTVGRNEQMMPAYDMATAATLVPCSRRFLQKFLSQHPTDKGGCPFYFPVGLRKMFTQQDIERVRQAMREEERCRLNSSRRAKVSRRIITAAAPTSESSLTEAHALIGPRLQRELSKAGR